MHLATGSYKFTDIHSDALPQLPTPFVNSTWVVITAWNPASNDQVTFEQNAKAQAELRVILESRYDAVFAARGDDSDPKSSYKGEEMLAVAVEIGSITRAKIAAIKCAGSPTRSCHVPPRVVRSALRQSRSLSHGWVENSVTRLQLISNSLRHIEPLVRRHVAVDLA